MKIFVYAAATVAAVGLSTGAFAQANPPANNMAPANAQEQAVDENPNQTSGEIAEIDAAAHTLKLKDGTVFTVKQDVDLSSFKAGNNVLITLEADTNEATSVKMADAVPEENDPNAPVEGQAPPASPVPDQPPAR